MEPTSCMIVDDEPIARDLLKNYCARVPFLTVAAVCKDGLEALEILQREKIDLVILDINMPKLSGLSLLRTLADPPDVIISSAHSEFAIEGFDLSVVDYLLKPYSFERFLKALGKIKTQRTSSSAPEFIFVKCDQKHVRLPLEEIDLVEACGNYLKIHRHGRYLLIRQSMNELEQSLPADKFLRIHKSFIVPVDRIEFIEGNQVKTKTTLVPVGKVYKNLLTERLKIS